VFQSLGRDSVGLDWTFWTFYRYTTAKFQSLGRDSVGLDPSNVSAACLSLRFQSLGRDSVGLDVKPLTVTRNWKEVSIPRSGFCWFGRASINTTATSSKRVSIPRSGFCWFGRSTPPQPHSEPTSFNPSVGILLVWTD